MENDPNPIERLLPARYISLTTYRRDGSAVATPVWFAGDGSGIVLFTGAQTGKAKRLRRDARVSVAPCSLRGTVSGPSLAGTASILPDIEGVRVMKLITDKYRIAKRALDLVVAVIRIVRRRPQTHSIYIRVEFPGESTTPTSAPPA